MAFISSKRTPDGSRTEKASCRTSYGPTESERTAWTEQNHRKRCWTSS